MTGPLETVRRVAGQATHQLRSLPILALSVHSACNCRCVMCDIWTANAQKREISRDELAAHVDAMRRLHVRRVMLTGGEPLLHSNLWALCGLLRDEGIAVTLVTTGLLIERHADAIAATCDHVVVSIDGPAEVHDAIRRAPGGFDRIARGVEALVGAGLTSGSASRQQRAKAGGEGKGAPKLTARCVVQAANCRRIWSTIDSAMAIGMHEISFLAADLTSTAFNRPEPWSEERRASIAVGASDLAAFADAIQVAIDRAGAAFDDGLVVGGVPSLRRIHQYYAAVAGLGPFPRVRCNAPWVSAVLEPGGVLRPCFFHAPYDGAAFPEGGVLDLGEVLNGDSAVAFRRGLDVSSNDVCRRCVCSLSLPATRGA
jgi:MoaA/NifB/PqqE/SkfB family radical SAM enzyme